MPWSNKQKSDAAKRVREGIFDALGRTCNVCGSPGTAKNPLELDHKNGDRDYSLPRISRWSRAIRLRKEHAAGKIRVLCRGCNVSDEHVRIKNGREAT